MFGLFPRSPFVLRTFYLCLGTLAGSCLFVFFSHKTEQHNNYKASCQIRVILLEIAEVSFSEPKKPGTKEENHDFPRTLG